MKKQTFTNLWDALEESAEAASTRLRADLMSPCSAMLPPDSKQVAISVA
jgi:predicted XRE-type DNA-binding protein